VLGPQKAWGAHPSPAAPHLYDQTPMPWHPKHEIKRAKRLHVCVVACIDGVASCRRILQVAGCHAVLRWSSLIHTTPMRATQQQHSLQLITFRTCNLQANIRASDIPADPPPLCGGPTNEHTRVGAKNMARHHPWHTSTPVIFPSIPSRYKYSGEAATLKELHA
jgi:hypothetical protein